MTWVPRCAAAVAALSVGISLAQEPQAGPAPLAPVEEAPPRAAPAGPTRVIEFELNGLHYFTQSQGDVTVMFAHLPQQVPHYAVMEVSVLNGSRAPLAIRPESFRFLRNGGSSVRALPANTVVSQFLERGSRNDVIKLVTAYEAALYGFQRGKATNGYEQRRQAAMADSGPSKFAAAATASALVFVGVTLKPGESTDGAIFFPVEAGKPLGQGKVVVTTSAGEFSFETATLEGVP